MNANQIHYILLESKMLCCLYETANISIQYALDTSVFVSVNMLLCLFVCCEVEADELLLKELSSVAPVAILLHNHLIPRTKMLLKQEAFSRLFFPGLMHSVYQYSNLLKHCLST